MPLDARMPDAGALVRATDITVPAPAGEGGHVPVVVFDDGILLITAVAVTHGRAVPALAYRFDTPDGSVTFSGDTTVNEDLIALARGADILVHQVADLDYLKRHGTDEAELARMAALHTDVSQVGGVAERARVGELILSHYLPADPAAISAADWAQRAGRGFSGTTTAGRDGLRRMLAGQAPACSPGHSLSRAAVPGAGARAVAGATAAAGRAASGRAALSRVAAAARAAAAAAWSWSIRAAWPLPSYSRCSWRARTSGSGTPARAASSVSSARTQRR